jgi:hypothetical protein
MGRQGRDPATTYRETRFLDEAESLDAEPDLGALPPERGLGVQA